MTQRLQARLTIVNKWGLHARAAFALASRAMKYISRITVEKEGSVADAKRMDELLLLTAGPGDEITVSADGPDGGEALAAITELVQGGFNER